MKFILLVISLISFLLYLNIIITDFINLKLNPYTEDTENEKKIQQQRAKIKIALIIIMSLSFSGVLTI